MSVSGDTSTSLKIPRSSYQVYGIAEKDLSGQRLTSATENFGISQEKERHGEGLEFVNIVSLIAQSRRERRVGVGEGRRIGRGRESRSNTEYGMNML